MQDSIKSYEKERCECGKVLTTKDKEKYGDKCQECVMEESISLTEQGF